MVFNPEGNGALSESLVNYRVLRVGDIAFEGHKNKDFLFGRFVLNDVGNGIMSPRFSSLRPIEYLNISFWKQYIHYEPIMRGILKNSTKLGTMMNELVIDDFLKQPIDVPTLKEQTAIGDFFRQLDAAIASHQRKLERVKELKKSLLQKMFPKDGEAFPELRFPNFTDAWEQRKLGEILEINQIPVPKPSSSYIRLGIRSHGKGTFHEQVEAGSGLAVDTMFKVETDNLIINITFAWELALAVTDAEDDGKLVSHRFPQYKFKSQYSPTFFKNLIYDKKFKSDLMLASPGGAGRNRVLKKSEFLDIERTVPKQIEEQTAIGNFFKQLDAAIASHQRKA